MNKITLTIVAILSFNLYAGQPQLNWHAGLATNGTDYWPSMGLSATSNINSHFALGGAMNAFFSYYGHTSATQTISRQRFFIDMNILIKPEIPVTLQKGNLVVYLAIYTGPTIVVETDFNSNVSPSRETSSYFGLNVMVTPGIQFHFNNGFGLFAEIGVVDHVWAASSANALMAASNLGISYAF